MVKSWALVVAWTLMMAAALAGPAALESPRLGDYHVRLTVDIALAYYFLTAIGLTRTSRKRWLATTPQVATQRLTWSLAWLAYFTHVLLAFHHVHQWSHAQAMEHTRQQSGLGEGILLSHFFTLLWTLDVGWWWSSPESYVRRPEWIGWCLHSFMAFVVFNATVIFESGPVRWVCAILFLVLAVLSFRRWSRESNPSTSRTP